MCKIVTNWLKERLCSECSGNSSSGDVPLPDIVATIDNSNLNPILESVLGDVPILYSDKWYQLCTKESLIEFLKYDNTDGFKYNSDSTDGYSFDCDDFAFRLHGNLSIPEWSSTVTGTCWLSRPSHAVNIFVDGDLDVYYIEPQTDELFLVSDKPTWKANVVWI